MAYYRTEAKCKWIRPISLSLELIEALSEIDQEDLHDEVREIYKELVRRSPPT